MADYGDPRLPARFWAKVRPEPATGCWLWVGAHQGAGYGTFWWERKVRLAHRVAYAVLRGDSTRELDHLCRVRACCNPDHLDDVAHRVNMLRSPISLARLNADKVTCPEGHPLSGANLYVDPHNGGRRCRTCRWSKMDVARKRRRAATEGARNDG